MSKPDAEKPRPIMERFWEKVDRDPDGCWEWQASAWAHDGGTLAGHERRARCCWKGTTMGVKREHKSVWLILSHDEVLNALRRDGHDIPVVGDKTLSISPQRMKLDGLRIDWVEQETPDAR